MEKFWNKAADGAADIYIFGDITSWAWDDTDVTAKSFVDDLNSFAGKPVTVHINSGGGDVFAALAIYNAIKSYKGGVTVSIEGLAASSASVIAMGGKPTRMASNALMMIHEPAVGLMGFYRDSDLTKVQNSLSAVRGSILATYATRVEESKVAEMVAAETWLNAQQALELGLIDEITDAVDLKVDDAQKMIFVNSQAISTKKFDAVKMRRAMEAKTMEINEQGFFDKLKTTITEALAPKAAETPAAEVIDAATIREQELNRIRALQELKGTNAAVNALIDVAISDGRTAEDIKPYIDAVAKVAVSPAQDAADKIVAVIRDQLTSGAEGVKGGQEAVTPEEISKRQSKKIADIANSMM